jgi:large subunit ribosomal protein L13Ae
MPGGAGRGIQGGRGSSYSLAVRNKFRPKASKNFSNATIIDCKGHLMGRLASIVAKKLLEGKKIICVRTEGINISGSHIRNKLGFLLYLQKRMMSNPRRGFYHHRSPAKMFIHTVRGMLPHKTYRGQVAMARLQSFEGIPSQFEKKSRVIVPEAFRITRLRPLRAYSTLGNIAAEVGWNHKDLVARLEGERMERAKAYFATKVAADKAARAKAASTDLSSVEGVLAAYGF